MRHHQKANTPHLQAGVHSANTDDTLGRMTRDLGAWLRDSDRAVPVGGYPLGLPELDEIVADANVARYPRSERPAALAMKPYDHRANETVHASPISLHVHVAMTLAVKSDTQIHQVQTLHGCAGSSGRSVIGNMSMIASKGTQNDDRVLLLECDTLSDLRSDQCFVCFEYIGIPKAKVLACGNGHAAHTLCWLQWERGSTQNETVLVCGACRVRSMIPPAARERAVQELSGRV